MIRPVSLLGASDIFPAAEVKLLFSLSARIENFFAKSLPHKIAATDRPPWQLNRLSKTLDGWWEKRFGF